MDRMIFLKLGIGVASLGLAGAIAGPTLLSSVLDDQPMRRPPVKEGYVLCDIHAHPSNKNPLEEKIKLLSSPGLVGLSQRYQATTILSYEEAVKLPGVEEITPGQLAKLGDGYFMRAQEVVGGKSHFHAVGFEGNYLPNFKNPMDAVKAIKSAGGVVGFNHPFSIPRIGGIFTLPNDDELPGIYELCAAVDFVEVHNAHNIDLVPYVLAMEESDQEAAKMVATGCNGHSSQIKPGTFSSDCHELYEQVKLAGFYVEASKLESMGTFLEAIKQGDILGAEGSGYVSRASFFDGIVGSRAGRLLEF